MVSRSKEPTFVHSEEKVIRTSPLAREFLQRRSQLNDILDARDNRLVKRFYNLDHNTYMEGELPALTKELMGLAVSAAMRCDDCIFYHVIQAYRLGGSRACQEETLNIALVIGGSIVIPHLRRVYALLEELYGEVNEP